MSDNLSFPPTLNSVQWNPSIRTPLKCNEVDISLNQDTMHGPSYTEMCTKLPLK